MAVTVDGGGEAEAEAEASDASPARAGQRQRTTVRLKTQRPSFSMGSEAWERLRPHVVEREKGSEVLQLLTAALGAVRACAQVSAPDVGAIAEPMECFAFEPGDAVQRESEAWDSFYVVQEGSLEVRAGGRVLRTVAGGESLGADTLLYGSERAVAVIATGHAIIWGVKGATFRQVLLERARANCVQKRRFLESISLFDGLPARQMELLSRSLLDETVPEGTVVVARGDDTKAMRFVRSGKLSVVDPSSGTELAHLRPGDCFGERALLYREPRAATVTALEGCELLCIGAEQLGSVLGTDLHAYLERCVVLSGLRLSPAYSQFTSAQQCAIMQAMDTRDCAPGEPVAAALGQDVRAVVVIRGSLLHEGATAVSRGQCYEAGGLSPSTEDSAQTPGPRVSSAAGAREPIFDYVSGPQGVRISVLSKDGLVRALGRRQPVESAEQASEYASKMLLVKKVPVFRHLSHEQTENVVGALQLRHYSKGESVIEQGAPGNSLFVIARGEVTVTIDDRLIRTQGRNACFGERALLFDERRTATVTVSSASAEIWTIDKTTFGNIVKGKMRQDLINRIKIQDTKVTLQDLRPTQVIGTGAFSVVRMAEHRTTGVRYALKSVKKQNGKIPVEMVNECSILLENDHPFVLYVVKTFETSLHICMLTELITGGDLHGAIRKIPTVLSRKQAQFYTGSLVIAIEALWDRNIVYRDLKPENVMLDAQGYLKIIDFGISKKLEDTEGRTFTMVGTPHYMAPEVMQGKGYGIEVDLWSLGIMLFEFVCGYLPFADELEEPTEVCTMVLSSRLIFPRAYKDALGRELIQALLCRNPEQRLGAGANGCADIKAAGFFKNGDESPGALFDQIMGRELDPPLLPSGESYCEDDDCQGASFGDEEDLWPEAELRLSRRRRGGRLRCLGQLAPCCR